MQYSPGDVDAFIDDIHDLIDTQLRYALRLMRDHPTDVLMMHFLASDNASHALWRYMDAAHPLHAPTLAPKYGDALLKVYQHLDEAIQALISNLQPFDYAQGGPPTSNLQPPNINVIVMSDHGFGPLHKTVNLNVLFLQAGLMQLKPRALTRLRYAMFQRGLTPKGVYRMLERIGLQNITARVSRQTRNQVVGKFLSFEDVDWSRTIAYSIGHVGQVYLNLKGREPQGIVEPSEYQAARQRVVDVLRSLRDPRTGKSMVERLIPREEAAWGPYVDRAPDLHLVLDSYRAIAFPLFATEGKIVTQQIRGDSGCHRLHGVFVACGPAFAHGAVEGARLIDLAPTILHVVGAPIPDDMDGRVLTEALSTEMRARAVQMSEAADYAAEQVDMTPEEQAQVEERLRALGYLG